MTIKTRAELKSENAADFPDNAARLISPADLRGQMDDVVDSMLMDEDDAGLVGPPGPPGPQGPPGSGLEIKGSVPEVGDLPAGGEPGDVWVVQSFDPDHLFMWDGTQWVDLGEGGGSDFTYGTAGAITWPVTDRMKEQVYLLDFIPQSEHAAIRNATSTYDCADAFEAATASVTVPSIAGDPAGGFYVGGPEVIFPPGMMYFSRTLEIKKTMTLTGHGGGHRQFNATILQFAANITGIAVNSLTGFQGDMDPPVYPPAQGNSKGGDATIIRNLMILSKSGGVPNFALNTTGSGVGHGIGHGIWVRASCLIENCATYGFPQHGIYIRAAAVVANTPDGRAVYGNANLTQIYHTACLTNGGCGLYIDGPDTNACLFFGMDISNNRLSGIHDSCLIGNTHITPHTDINGKDALCCFSETDTPPYSPYYCRDAWRANDNAPIWAASTAYTTVAGGSTVRNVGNLYRCILSGTSAASGGPTGTGTSILDGTARWIYVSVDAGIRVPPAGHAQSADVWAKVFPGSAANFGGHPFYPYWPAGPGGITPHNYRLGYNFWFDQISAANILIGPYVEVNQPYAFVSYPSIVLGGLQYDPASSGSLVRGSLGTAVIAPGLAVDGKTDATNTRATRTSLARAAGDALVLQVDGDGSTPAINASPLAYKWDETTGTWMIQHANNAGRIAQRFTTTLNTLTGGMTTPVAAGNTMFTQGIWLGRHVNYARYFTLAEAAPTTGEHAAGEHYWNATPAGMGSVLGWRCITAGTPGTWQAIPANAGQQTISDGLAFNLTPATSPRNTFYTGTMLADRAAGLITTGAIAGLTYRITRTATGAFNLNVGTGPLKAMPANSWCEVCFDGTAWYLSAYGVL